MATIYDSKGSFMSSLKNNEHSAKLGLSKFKNPLLALGLLFNLLNQKGKTKANSDEEQEQLLVRGSI